MFSQYMDKIYWLQTWKARTRVSHVTIRESSRSSCQNGVKLSAEKLDILYKKLHEKFQDFENFQS